MNKKLLIIDDDEKLNDLLTHYLSDFGFDLLSASHPDAGLKKLRKHAPDLVILDVMLPGVSGFELCKIIRRESSAPIIMLTARGDLMDRVVGLELGADDYMPKPFEPRELVARIQSILRRTGGMDNGSACVFGKLRIDFAKRSAALDGQALELTSSEFSALSFLVKNKGKALSRDEILQELSGIDCDAYNRSVDITMSRLRHKLMDDPKNPSFIKTVWGHGYIFIGDENETV